VEGGVCVSAAGLKPGAVTVASTGVAVGVSVSVAVGMGVSDGVGVMVGVSVGVTDGKTRVGGKVGVRGRKASGGRTTPAIMSNAHAQTKTAKLTKTTVKRL
jgi:hypothetical protein